MSKFGIIARKLPLLVGALALAAFTAEDVVSAQESEGEVESQTIAIRDDDSSSYLSSSSSYYSSSSSFSSSSSSSSSSSTSSSSTSGSSTSSSASSTSSSTSTSSSAREPAKPPFPARNPAPEPTVEPEPEPTESRTPEETPERCPPTGEDSFSEFEYCGVRAIVEAVSDGDYYIVRSYDENALIEVPDGGGGVCYASTSGWLDDQGKHWSLEHHSTYIEEDFYEWSYSLCDYVHYERHNQSAETRRLYFQDQLVEYNLSESDTVMRLSNGIAVEHEMRGFELYNRRLQGRLTEEAEFTLHVTGRNGWQKFYDYDCRDENGNSPAIKLVVWEDGEIVSDDYPFGCD